MAEQLKLPFPDLCKRDADEPYWEAPRSPVFEDIKIDLDARNAKGYKEHGKILRADDSRDWLREAYEEALDQCVYLKAELMKRVSKV